MPIYEYRCSSCEHEFSVLQKVSDPAPDGCEKCDKPVAKVMSLSSFHLKGSGWYTTDYKRKPEPKAAAADTSDSAAVDKKVDKPAKAEATAKKKASDKSVKESK